MKKINDQRGIIAISAVAALAILILAVGVGITAFSFNEVFVAEGQRKSTKARLYAEAGARDALVRIARDKTYNCTSEDCYSIDFVTNGCSANEGCARVSVSSGSGSSSDPKIITSKGRVTSITRKIQVDVVFDSSLHGEIATTTWREVVN